MSDPFQTAVVTGASRGFGRAIAADATEEALAELPSLLGRDQR